MQTQQAAGIRVPYELIPTTLDGAFISPAPGGQAVWQYAGTGASWTQVGGPAGQIFGGGYGLVATSPSTGDLWRC